MQNEVIKIGNVSFLSQTDKTIIKKIFNSDFEINDDFSGNRSKITFDSLSESTAVESGMEVVSNVTEVTANPVKVYFAKYRKNTCDWGDVLYYGVLDEYDDITMDEWQFLYSNDQYCVYRIFAYTLPTTLPLSGELPSAGNAPFIKYESFKNVWLRSPCTFKYETSVVSLVDSPGTDSWVLADSGDTQCSFVYTKSTPFGCNFDVPSTDTIVLGEDCECLELSSSSSSESSSSSTVFMSSQSSASSESTPSSESSSLNSSSSEVRMSPKNVDTIYLRIVGEPFVASEYVLPLVSANAVPLVWTASSHSSQADTVGTVTVTMNASGRFLLSVNATVSGSAIVIENALLSNIRNDNFAHYSTYLKGLSTVCSGYITTKYTDDAGDQTLSYDCIISYESLKRNTGSPKKLSEIIYDYEIAELSIDDDSEKVNIYFGKANIEKDDSSDICRAWGLFCLNYVEDGKWSYSNDDQEIELSRTDGGCWTLYRKYKNSLTDTQEIYMEIDSKTVTSNLSGEYDGFAGTCIVPRSLIRGGVTEASANDICNDKDTVVAFYSGDSCSQNADYNPYLGNLALTVDGGGWDGESSYNLAPNVISANLSVWNWSSNSKANGYEYAVFFSHDGILWKLMLMKFTSTSRSYLFTEFIKENQDLNSFSSIFQKVHKSYISLNGSWGTSNATITISGIED